MKVSVETAAAVVAAALKVELWEVPGVRLSVAGFAVTPAGRPAIDTVTLPANEFNGFAVTLTGEPEAPAVMVSEAGATDRLKSGGGGGAMVAVTADV